MIKFWKNAARGKSGCPVRPPESSSGSGIDFKCLVNTQSLIDSNIESDSLEVFRKTSKLSLTLYDILVKKVALHYFVNYMESINKREIIKCWIELENFKNIFNETRNEVNNYVKITRTKSFDLNYDNDKNQGYSRLVSKNTEWDSKSDTATCSKRDQQPREYSSISCHKLTSNSLENSMNSKNLFNVTQEAINLFKNYVALEAPNQLDLPDSIRKTVISNICQPEGQIKEDCFKPVQDMLYNHMEENYFVGFQNSPFYVKSQIDILTNDSLNLEDILYNETILFYFTEYLEQESCRVLLEFLMSITHFRDNSSNNHSDNEQNQSDAIILYEKYFSLQATSPIGFPTDIRLKVESDICVEGGPLPTCFDLPYQIVFKILSSYVKTFLESDVYYKYVSEMFHSVEDQLSPSHKTHSDCSSEFSISTHNTLLAMGDHVFHKKKRNSSVPDMTIDSNQLYNADALWQRKRQDGLNLGRVNSLGRFESKFEPDPDKRQRSVFKKMVSRFVPSSSSKVEEEMAWQIAHMIVKDVTDLTMAPPDNDPDNIRM